MPIQIIPRTKSGGEAFTEAFMPYLQMAFQQMLAKKSEERAFQRQKELKQIPTPITEYQQQTISLQKEQNKQAAIKNGYAIAQDTFSTYLETNPDDIVGAKATAATAFDGFMANSGFGDITYLSVTQPEKVPEPEEKPERKLPAFVPETTLPSTAPVPQRTGNIVRQMIERHGLPGQAPTSPEVTGIVGRGLGAVGRGLGQFGQGLTGIQKLPQIPPTSPLTQPLQIDYPTFVKGLIEKFGGAKEVDKKITEWLEAGTMGEKAGTAKDIRFFPRFR